MFFISFICCSQDQLLLSRHCADTLNRPEELFQEGEHLIGHVLLSIIKSFRYFQM